jgi:predicted 2-oxoglutarate/Fe(II)-dependent dioxygenase YbiX
MIRVIDNFLTDEECQNYIQLIEHLTKEKNVRFSESAYNFNHKYTDNKLAQSFYEKGQQLNLFENCTTLGPNKLIMVSKYTKGENFGIHTDTGLFYDKINKVKTRYTLLIYLNDDFEGGNTVFYDNNLNITETIVPKKGSCLLFDIDLLHEGKKVTQGSKYWIGCEILGPMVTI